MKIWIREAQGHTIPIPVPTRLVLYSLKRKMPELDTDRVFRLLRKYRGMDILTVEEHNGDYVRIRL